MRDGASKVEDDRVTWISDNAARNEYEVSAVPDLDRDGIRLFG